MYLLSIIIPIYNSKKYLVQCIESIVSQMDCDTQLVCIDDGSSDGSLELLKNIVPSNSNVKIITQENRGVSKTRNRGIIESEGKYIMFVDSDDYIEKGSLKKIRKVLLKNDVDVLIHGAFTFGSQNTPEWMSHVINTHNKKIDTFSIKDIFQEPGCRPFLWQHVIKTELIKKTNLIINDNLKIGEDQSFQIKYLSRANKVIFIKDKLYNYRLDNPNSIMNVYYKDVQSKIEQHILMIEDVCVDSYINKLDIENRTYIVKWIIDTLYWDILNQLYWVQYRYCAKINEIFNIIGAEDCINCLSCSEAIKYNFFKMLSNSGYDEKKLLEMNKEELKRLMDGE